MSMAADLADLGPLHANAREYVLGWGQQRAVDGDLALFRSGVSHPQLNGVLRLRHGPLDAAIAEAIEALAGVPWLWMVGADSRPGLTEDLYARGAVDAGTAPILAADLTSLTAEPGPPDLRVETVTGTAALTDWVHAYRASFGLAEDQVPELVKLEESRPTEHVIRFAGIRHDRIIATAALFTAHGVAGIYHVATQEPHRRQGIAARLTLAAAQAARDQGLRIGAALTASTGAAVYRRLGFTEMSRYRILQLPARHLH